MSQFKEGWLEFAAEWTKLTREQEEKAKPADSKMLAGESFSEGGDVAPNPKIASEMRSWAIIAWDVVEACSIMSKYS